MKKFLTPVAFECENQEQQKRLIEELKKLGYNILGTYGPFYKHLVTNAMGINGRVQTFGDPSKLIHRYKARSEEEFLALAAMIEGIVPIVGEWVIGEVDSVSNSLKKGQLAKCLKAEQISNSFWASINTRGGATSEAYSRKATKEEIINHFNEEGFVVPEKWYCKPSNRKEAEELVQYFDIAEQGIHLINYTNLIPNVMARGLSNRGWGLGKSKQATKITFEQFKKHILMKKETHAADRFPHFLKPKDAQRIIDIACSTWKVKLAAEWAKDIVLGLNIRIEEVRYKEMRNACTAKQHELFDEIFGKDEDFLPEGTICWVWDDIPNSKVLRVADGNGKFYSDGFKYYIHTATWKNYEVVSQS